jgi:molybdate transport system substrate-binding protein
MIRRAVLAVGTAALAAGIAGCSEHGPARVQTVRLTVLVAASIGDPVAQVAERFAEANPGVEVAVSAAASSTIVQQVLDGLPADVVVTADEATMDRVAERVRGVPQVVATNRLVLAVPAEGTARVLGLEALGDPVVRSGLCAPQVPCGRYAGEWLMAAGIDATPVTEEPDVRSLVAKLQAGELDAGVVYATDIAGAGRALRAVDVPAPPAPAARYPAAVTTAVGAPSERVAAATAFVADLFGPGRQVLLAAGFGPP